MSCRKVLGSAVGYRRICGGFWCGSIARCDECEEIELRRRVLKKQEMLLDKELANSKEPT